MKMGIAILSLLIATLFACNPQAINIQTGDVSVQQSLGIRGPLLITDIQVIDHNEFENRIIIIIMLVHKVVRETMNKTSMSIIWRIQ